MTIHIDDAFAVVDRDNDLERVGGGNETEVYRTDDERFVVKLKHELGGEMQAALSHAQEMRAAAERFVACLGPEHSIETHYVIARDSDGRAQVLVIQPYLRDAHPLSAVKLDELTEAQRRSISAQLRVIIKRSLRFYRRHGEMPDLYGRTSTSSAERALLKRRRMLPKRIWSFLVERHLLRSQNLMLTSDGRVVLVDYDAVRRSPTYRRVYFATRWLLFWRDRLILLRLRVLGPR